MMYSKIKYAISVYGLTSLENINKIQVLQINCQRFSHLKTTDTQQIQRIHIVVHCLAHAPPSVHGDCVARLQVVIIIIKGWKEQLSAGA